VPGDRPLLRSTFLDCQPPAAGSVSYFHSGESTKAIWHDSAHRQLT